jgi:hypothetical protein
MIPPIRMAPYVYKPGHPPSHLMSDFHACKSSLFSADKYQFDFLRLALFSGVHYSSYAEKYIRITLTEYRYRFCMKKEEGEGVLWKR